MAEPRIRIHIAGSTVYKLLLLSAIVAVSVAFMWYTYEVIHQLRAEAQAKVRSYVRLWVRAVDQNTPSSETQLIFDEIISQANFPIVVASAEREPNFWRNLDGVRDNDRSTETLEQVREVMQEMRAEHGEVEIVFGDSNDSAGIHGVNYFYHGDSELIESLKIAPYIQIGMVVSVLFIGFVGFTNIKRSDERHIWVGMAKETAHQLGTPISSLLGWLEIMRDRDRKKATANAEVSTDAPSQGAIFDAMETDVNRLQQVANRFGLIGSSPGLQPNDLNSVVGDIVDYFRKRLPFGGKGTTIDFEPSALPQVLLNPELFGWSIENLIKNAMEAVDSREGKITLATHLSTDGKLARLTVTDNGKGIPIGVQRRIFRPGFSSKKRGWGLGLTLARRIVDEYHNGRLILVKSMPGETVFQISLPVKQV